MTTYYNEIDPFAAEWLRQLIKAGHIAPGDVDTRSIVDVKPDDLRGYTQCHFFAGIGVWSYALRRAGWPDERSVWTGSCPCQPFSAAGAGAGFADERHLWPHFHWLISQCRPPVVAGEQVASKDADAWIDLVQDDMEAMGYAFGAIPFPSASVGAPHIRDRDYWLGVAHAGRAGDERVRRPGEAPGTLDAAEGETWQRERRGVAVGASMSSGWLAHDDDAGLERDDYRRRLAQGHEGHDLERDGATGGMGDPRNEPSERNSGTLSGTQAGEHGSGIRVNGRVPVGPEHAGSGLGWLADADRGKRDGFAELRWIERNGADAGRTEGSRELGARCDNGGPGPTNGFWRDADWLFCRDGKWRPVSPKPQPMVDGSAESLGRVRDEDIAQTEEEIDAWAVETQSVGAEAVRDLWLYLSEEPHAFWSAGRIPGLHEAPFLLAFMRQLSQQGWKFSQCTPLPREKTFEDELRVLWLRQRAAGTSHQYGLDGQPPGEHSDPLHLLSSLLARYAHSAWGDAYAAYAETKLPLVVGAKNRVGRLRGYGNAINAVQAQIFIETVIETIYPEIDAGPVDAVRLEELFA